MMFDAVFLTVSRAITRRRRWVTLGLALLFAAALGRLPFLKLDNNMERMLPASPAVIDGIRFLQQAGFSEQVILSLSLPDDEADPHRLISAADTLATALPGPLVSAVMTGLPTQDPLAEWDAFLPWIPQMIDDTQRDAFHERLSEPAINRQIGGLYRRLMAPGASMGPLLAADPLGIASPVMNRLQALSLAFGYRIKMIGGYLFSDDERHALLILRTPVSLTDGFGARALLAHIDACIEALPTDVRAVIVAGHRHTVSNEDVIRRDVGRTGLAAALGFGLLLLAVFRDRRAGIIFITPFIAVVIAIAVAAWAFSSVSLFILGMSVVLAGIAMDYAIHAYVARRSAGDAGLAHVARPVSVGACTTAAVFVAFFFSSVPGYSQLAVFSLLSLVICLLLSLFVLPAWIRMEPNQWAGWHRLDRRAGRRATQRILVGVWLILILLLAASATRLVFQRDIEQFDGSTQAVWDAQRTFHRIWGGENQPALLVVTGSSVETVWRDYERVSADAIDRLGDDAVITLAPLWPSYETRSRRLAAWRQIWANDGNAIRDHLAAAQARYGFTPDAFQKFHAWVEGRDAAPGFPDAAFFTHLRERFLITTDAGIHAIAYVDDTDINRQRLAHLTASDETTIRFISRTSLAHHLSEAIAHETIRLAALAGILILIPLTALLRNPRLVALALIPVLTAVTVMLGVLPILAMPLTAASLIAAMIVVGLVIDYGVYMVYDETHRTRAADGIATQRSTTTALAIHLSAITTLIGASALLLARHPVMFAIGVTLVSGVMAGYAAALWVVPALFRLTLTLRPAQPETTEFQSGPS